MSAAKDKSLALAASIRLPNLPSVWCNVFSGLLIGSMRNPIGLTPLATSLVAATCLYLAGNLLNDWADRHWDSSHRPERALPRAIFTPRCYLALALCLIVIAITLAALTSLPTLGICLLLTFAIVTYTWAHKKHAWSVIPMGLCRALLPIMGYAAIQPNDTSHATLAIALAAAHLAYVMMLSITARAESRTPDAAPGVTRSLGFLLPPAILLASIQPVLPIGDWHHPLWPAMAFGIIPYGAWTMLALTHYRRPVPRLVSALLAGIPLVDSLLLLPATLWILLDPPNDPNPFPLILLVPLFVWLLAFASGRLLQRIVPAT